jgi:steroid delta-isomerase-like uncharacterized protein
MSTKDPKALMRRWFEEANKGKAAALAVIDEIGATSYVFHHATSEDIRGLKDFKQYMSMVYDAFPDNHMTIDDMFVEGDKVATRYTFTGTHKGKYRGIPATNKKVSVSMIEIGRTSGGKFVEGWQRFDTLGMMQQLGVIPTPGKGK